MIGVDGRASAVQTSVLQLLCFCDESRPGGFVAKFFLTNSILCAATRTALGTMGGGLRPFTPREEVSTWQQLRKRSPRRPRRAPPRRPRLRRRASSPSPRPVASHFSPKALLRIAPGLSVFWGSLGAREIEDSTQSRRGHRGGAEKTIEDFLATDFLLAPCAAQGVGCFSLVFSWKLKTVAPTWIWSPVRRRWRVTGLPFTYVSEPRGRFSRSNPPGTI